jgi:hypothetical protein
MPEGDELNYDDFKRVLTEVTTGTKFPAAAWKPPRSNGKFIAKYDEWEEYRIEMFFLNTTYYTGTNQISRPNSGTRTSSKSVIEEWDDMKVAAVDFIRVLQLVLKGNNTDSVNMLDAIQLSSKEKFIDPISFAGTQRLSGVRLTFILKIFTNCLIQDYVDGGIIVLPESDDCTFDADLVVVRNEVLAIIEELGLTSYDAVDGETPGGAVNGINATFTTAQEFIISSLKVYLNGVRQKVIEDYNTTGNSTIIFVTSPLATDVILVDYEINNN